MTAQFEAFAGRLTRSAARHTRGWNGSAARWKPSSKTFATATRRSCSRSARRWTSSCKSTLERRLAESFKVVSDHLEAVQRGLGEMRALANGVGDLQRVLTNVKSRGTWAEYQLEALLQDIITPEQYGKNWQRVPMGTSAWTSPFACPGRSGDPPAASGCRSTPSSRRSLRAADPRL